MPLPDKKSQKEKNYLKKKYLIYGDPKCGKSTTIANMGDDKNEILFFATEAGHSELEIYKWKTKEGEDPTKWEHFEQMILDITETESQFKAVAIDTVDNLYFWCAKHVSKKAGKEHESDFEFGKGYGLIKEKLLSTINYLTQKGIGVIFVSHKQEGDQVRDGRKMSVISPTLPNTGKKVVTGLCDYIFYFYIDSDGNRLIRTKGTESIQAGDRSGNLPEVMKMDHKELVKQLIGGK